MHQTTKIIKNEISYIDIRDNGGIKICYSTLPNVGLIYTKTRKKKDIKNQEMEKSSNGEIYTYVDVIDCDGFNALCSIMKELDIYNVSINTSKTQTCTRLDIQDDESDSF